MVKPLKGENINMADNENFDLKSLAQNAAAGIPVPMDNPVEAVAPVQPVQTEPQKPKDYNPLMEPYQGDDVTRVGDMPVVMAIPPQPQNAPSPELSALMSTPSPVQIQPTPIGLDSDSLDTPANFAPVQPMQSGSIPVDDPLANLRYGTDGSVTDGQRQIMAAYLPNVPEDERYEFAHPVFDQVDDELRLMIVQAHMPVRDAQQAVYNNAIQTLQAANAKYMEEHPTTASIVIDKTSDVNDLGLTKEEHDKLERVKKLRLVLIEDKDLANIELEHPDERHKIDYIRSVEGSGSTYSVPLPMFGDFITVKGAQIIQMANLVQFEDSDVVEKLGLKASLIYDKLINGSILKKYNEEGVSKMSYAEFINKFPYEDVDIAVFAILCASTIEESSTSMTCPNCSHTWNQHYNVKKLLKMDNIPELYKRRTEDILANKSNDVALRALYEDRRKVRRYKSPFTNNIYDLSYPTVARVIDLMKRVDNKDPLMVYNSAIAMYLNQVLIYNGKTGKYIPVSAEDPGLMLDTIQTLTNEDVTMIANNVRDDLHYSVDFVMDAECPNCKRSLPQTLSIDTAIFLTAQDSLVEIG